MPAEPIRVIPPSPQDIADAGVVKLADLLAAEAAEDLLPAPVVTAPGAVPEIGGRRDGLDPTRYGDWEKNGRCIDF